MTDAEKQKKMMDDALAAVFDRARQQREERERQSAAPNPTPAPAALAHGAPVVPATKAHQPVAVTQAPQTQKTPAPAPRGQVAQPAPGGDVADVHDLGEVNKFSWIHTDERGKPLGTIPNFKHMLEFYGFRLGYDVIRKQLQVTHPGQRGTPDNVRSKAIDTVTSLAALNRLPKADVGPFMLSIGDDNPLNPVMDFITSRPWDGVSRIADLVATVQTRQGYDRELFALLLRRWLISAVAAAAKPMGFWSKGVLVFQGEQSLGKTAWIRALLPPALRDLVKIDASIDPSNKDSIISAVSHWLVELGELDGTLRKADIARLKGFISQDVDQFRRPYGRSEEKFQRRTVFFASVNPEQFLADETGNVRWWTVPVIGVNHQHGIDTQQLWAEVFTWFQAGERWWLERDEEARLEASNTDHQQGDPIEELVLSRYDRAKPATRLLTATEVLVELGYDKPTRAMLNQAGCALKKHFGKWSKNNGRKVFKVPNLIRRRDDGLCWTPEPGHPEGWPWTPDPAMDPGMDPEEKPF